MKRVSFRIRNFDEERFLTFNIDSESKLDEELFDYIEAEEPKNLVPIIFETGEEFDTFSYNVTDKIRLSELSNQEITADMVLMVLRSLVLTLIDMTERRVPLSYLVLHRDYIYVDSDYKIEFICIPLEDIQDEVDVNGFLRNLLANLRFDPSENGDYVAKLFTHINNPVLFNLRNMVSLMEELMSDMNIEISENDLADDIYVEYQEVNEEPESSMDFEEDNSIQETEEEDGENPDQETGEENEENPDQEAGEEDEENPDQEAGEEDGENPDQETGEEDEENPDRETREEDGENPNREAGEEDEENPDRETGEEGEENLNQETGEEDEENPNQETGEEDGENPDRKIVAENKVEAVREFREADENEKIQEADEDEKIQEADLNVRKSVFKTKETPPASVILQDELDEFLAEKELEEKEVHHEESGLKIKKNIKINRASIVKNTQEERKAEEQKEMEKETDPGLAKVNPYLIRVNTKERVVITKQNFKIGKAGVGVDYTVHGNGAVSRVHAVITNKEGNYYIRDNKSMNHTYLNETIVPEGEDALLTHDSRIVLGDEEFVFKLS